MTGPGPSPTRGIQYLIGTTASDPTADTYILVGSLNALPAYGPKRQDFTFEDVTAGTITHFPGARDDGSMTIPLGMDLSDAGQLALLSASSDANVSFDYNHKIVYNDARPAQSSTVTITIASPGVVTWTGHGLAVGTGVSFATTGALPTGLVAGTTYYVKTVLDANTFTLSATKGGTVINTTGTQSGVQTGTTVPAGTTDVFKGKVTSFERNPGNSTTVSMVNVVLMLKAGTLTLTPRLP